MEVFTRWHAWETARADIAASGAQVDLDGLERAVGAARRWHGEQRRPTGAPTSSTCWRRSKCWCAGRG
ncbi:hypothetical protein ACFQY7_32860 [Actinomadura luteofluorescens]|uniref:hypothetical protein n=1 Tax=Actinomadura luteofluorescens TaxID=46163 RepID=UPI003640D410